ncbi:hypothetical protein HMPREF9137_0694 [Prevotella denticola F0289]|nr:hypothetical protein HMPREF9137_0694 [Prevotella denticola F0289]
MIRPAARHSVETCNIGRIPPPSVQFINRYKPEKSGRAMLPEGGQLSAGLFASNSIRSLSHHFGEDRAEKMTETLFTIAGNTPYFLYRSTKP